MKNNRNRDDVNFQNEQVNLKNATLNYSSSVFGSKENQTNILSSLKKIETSANLLNSQYIDSRESLNYRFDSKIKSNKK
jgi:hypothetical protein